MVRDSPNVFVCCASKPGVRFLASDRIETGRSQNKNLATESCSKAAVKPVERAFCAFLLRRRGGATLLDGDEFGCRLYEIEPNCIHIAQITDIFEYLYCVKNSIHRVAKVSANGRGNHSRRRGEGADGDSVERRVLNSVELACKVQENRSYNCFANAQCRQLLFSIA